MTDRNLEEAIFQLQKLNTENGVKQLVEEAAQLFASGRQMEAGALMEKAEAILARSGNGSTHQGPVVVASEKPKASQEAGKVDEQAVVNVAVKLADGLAHILTGAFRELELHILGETRKLSTSFDQQLERLQTAVDGLGQLKSSFDQLALSVAEQKSATAAIGQKFEQAAATVTAVEATAARQDTELSALRTEATALRAEAGALRAETVALRGEAKESSAALVQQMDGLAARLGLQQEELAGLKSTTSEISRKVAGFVERVDRQAEIIRALSDTQVRRAAALEELLGVLTRLKTQEPLAAAAAAGGSL